MDLSKHIRKIPIKRKEDEDQQRPSPAERVSAKKKDVVEKNTETTQQTPTSDSVDWRAYAARLKADLDRCYQRQDQRIDTHVREKQAEFLSSFLTIVDNLEHALAHMQREDALFAGVRATYESMLALLRRHDVEPIQAQDQPFDPLFHEADGFVPAPKSQNEQLKVFEVTRRGYRRGDRILRPARVIVSRRSDDVS